MNNYQRLTHRITAYSIGNHLRTCKIQVQAEVTLPPQHNANRRVTFSRLQDYALRFATPGEPTLLGFGKPVQKSALVDDAGQICEPKMSAELFGMFFLAEDVYSAETSGRPLELTCYRRNLWWCSGQITLPRHISHIVSHQGRHMAVLELAASISASESIEEKATDIVFIPWKAKAAKRAANSSKTYHEDANVAGPPRNVPIELANGQELENGCVSVPISWKRLQFKHATANNGRRKGQQQHYVVQINLLGRIQTDGDGVMEDSDWIEIAEIRSGPVIVRGRCPGNFIGLRDVPLTGNSTAADKKQLQTQPEHQSSLSLGAQDVTTDQTQDNSNDNGVDAGNFLQQPDRPGPPTVSRPTLQLLLNCLDGSNKARVHKHKHEHEDGHKHNRQRQQQQQQHRPQTSHQNAPALPRKWLFRPARHHDRQYPP